MPAGTGRGIEMARKIMLGLCLCCLMLGACGAGDSADVRVGSLKGPTSLGILFLMDRAGKGETEHSYEFQMAVGAEELLPLMARGELDIALVPANVAALAYQRMEGGVTVIDINTLGVLCLVTGTARVSEVADLRGKTIYLTGKGTTPEAVLRYLLEQNGMGEGDCTLEFKSEAAEVAALLAKDPSAVGLLPQPFATAALARNGELSVVLDLNEEWERLQGGGGATMVTGVTIVRDAFLREREEAVQAFLREHRVSVERAGSDAAGAAALAVEAGIMADGEIARQAFPRCNITCITGEEMKDALSAYLEILAEYDAELVGGSLPGEDFYYLP